MRPSQQRLDRAIVDLRRPGPSGLIPSLARLEHEHIERVLRECNGKVCQTARVLGLHRRTLQYELAKFPVSR